MQEVRPFPSHIAENQGCIGKDTCPGCVNLFRNKSIAITLNQLLSVHCTFNFFEKNCLLNTPHQSLYALLFQAFLPPVLSKSLYALFFIKIVPYTYHISPGEIKKTFQYLINVSCLIFQSLGKHEKRPKTIHRCILQKMTSFDTNSRNNGNRINCHVCGEGYASYKTYLDHLLDKSCEKSRNTRSAIQICRFFKVTFPSLY